VAFLEKPDLIELMNENKFSDYFERAQNFNQYEKTTEILLSTKQKLRLAGKEEEKEEKKEDSLQKTMAAIFITIPVIASIKHVFYPIYKNEKEDKQLNTQRVKKGRNIIAKLMISYFFGRMFFAGLALSGNVREQDILYVREFLYETGAVLGVMSLAYLFSTLGQFKDLRKRRNLLRKSSEFILEQSEKQMWGNRRFNLNNDLKNRTVKNKLKLKSFGMLLGASLLIVNSQLL
jgi:hypothetical protein